MRTVVLGLLLSAGLLMGSAWCKPLFAADPVDYLRQVKPILAARCYACHGNLKRESGLRLDTAALARRGGEGGAAIVPGKSADSLLIQAVTGTNGLTRMPLDGEPLSPEQVSLLAHWIDEGAPAPDEPVPPDPRQHWAFRPPVRPQPPAVRAAAWVRNPIDAFLAAEHEARGLAPRPEAARHILLRRLYLDLIGLPPTRDELRAFLADESPDAYEKTVDMLLDSPRYGERWGRHWMDVWRYSDWAGYGEEIRESQRHIWRWRDWTIESLNQDKPYDQMILEMLAGDESAPGDPDTLRATGFLARNWFKFNRNVWLDNTIEHTSKAFLGITLNCARCHDHKYDPFSQADYYRFRAIFEPYDVRTDRVPGQADLLKDGLPRVYDANAGAQTFLFVRGNDAHPDKERPLPPAVPAALGSGQLDVRPVTLQPAEFYPGLRPFVQQEALAQAAADVAKAEAALAASRQAVADARQRQAELASKTTRPAPADKPALFLTDDFSQPQPEVWSTESGQWNYAASRLVQSQVGAAECRLLSKQDHPQDFSASFRFKITGGDTWRSVGLSFDVATDRFDAVYLSAYAGGPKVQIYHSRAGAAGYPSEGAKPLAVAVGQERQLKVEVRGQLVNVSLDGQLVLAYRLPDARQAGRFALWTFDAAAEFLHAEVTALPSDASLTEAPGPGQPLASPATAEGAAAAVAQTEAAAELAAKKLAAAAARQAAAAATVAADNGRYSAPIDANAESLAQAAAKAQGQAAVCQAEEELNQSGIALAEAQRAVKPEDEATKAAEAAAQAKANEAQAKLDVARTALAAATNQYAPLDTVYPPASTGRRLALARWIASRNNPLTARAAVNQMWLRHFGEAIVPSVFDLGLNGKPPSHPQLLDWLAVEFMERGWSMKALHRLMVTSNAYRMDSGTSGGDPNLAADRDNGFLWRMRSRRMEAEIVRDSVLHVAGQLDVTMGGPEIDQNEGQTSLRRSIYFRHAPEKQMTFLMLFDGPSVVECYRRNESVAPQQALALANSPLALNQSRLLAARLSQETASADGGAAQTAFVVAAFEQVLGRTPTAAEQTACEEFLVQQAAALAAPERLASFTAGPAASVKPAADPRQRARENLVHVLLNHNDFVTIR